MSVATDKQRNTETENTKMSRVHKNTSPVFYTQKLSKGKRFCASILEILWCLFLFHGCKCSVMPQKSGIGQYKSTVETKLIFFAFILKGLTETSFRTELHPPSSAIITNSCLDFCWRLFCHKKQWVCFVGFWVILSQYAMQIVKQKS